MQIFAAGFTIWTEHSFSHTILTKHTIFACLYSHATGLNFPMVLPPARQHLHFWRQLLHLQHPPFLVQRCLIIDLLSGQIWSTQPNFCFYKRLSDHILFLFSDFIKSEWGWSWISLEGLITTENSAHIIIIYLHWILTGCQCIFFSIFSFVLLHPTIQYILYMPYDWSFQLKTLIENL